MGIFFILTIVIILTISHDFDDQNHDLVMIWTIIPIKKLARLKKKKKKKKKKGGPTVKKTKTKKKHKKTTPQKFNHYLFKNLTIKNKKNLARLKKKKKRS